MPLLFFTFPAHAQEAQRDPFVPYGSQGGGTSSTAISDSGEDSQQPLISAPLSSYRVVGTILAPKEPIAAIRARDGRDYILTVGDKLGKDGGTVEKVTQEGITVRTGDATTEIAVSNPVTTVPAAAAGKGEKNHE